MAEPKQFGFTHQELAEMMVKRLDLKEGLWAIYLKFGIGGANIASDANTAFPAAIVPVLEIGLQRLEEPSPLSVDAAEMAPFRKARSTKASRKSRAN